MNKYEFGTQFKTKHNGVCTLIKYVNAKEVYVMFEDGTLVKARSGNLTNGIVKNPNYPTVFGHGINDFKIENLHEDKRYTLWYSILRRAYSETYHNVKPTYKNVEVADDWKRLSNFAKDIVKIPFFEKSISEGYELDKDILGEGLKLYSKDTCCFIPREINAFFGKKIKHNDLPTGVTFNKRLQKYVACLGVEVGKSNHLGVFSTASEARDCYVFNKKKELIRLAEKYKGEIDDKVYNKLKNYNFNLEDSS